MAVSEPQGGDRKDDISGSAERNQDDIKALRSDGKAAFR